jgi:hypothetical protein
MARRTRRSNESFAPGIVTVGLRHRRESNPQLRAEPASGSLRTQRVSIRGRIIRELVRHPLEQVT